MRTTIKNFKGAELKELIKRKGITEKMLAKDLNVTPQTISGWINGKKKPSTFNLEMLAKYLDVPPMCLTSEVPVCSNGEYQELTKKLEEILNIINEIKGVIK